MLEQIKKARKAEREKGRRQGDKGDNETNYRKEFRSKRDDDLVQEMV